MATSQSKEENIDFRDLQLLLQNSFDDASLEVVEQKISRLVPLDESYGSIVLKINVTIRRNDQKSEQLNLVAKTMNCSERPYFDFLKVLKKEVFMYVELMPKYQELERDVGISDVIDILPKYIGHRYSLDNKIDIIDENSVLLVENLNPSGFYTANRSIGKYFKLRIIEYKRKLAK